MNTIDQIRISLNAILWPGGLTLDDTDAGRSGNVSANTSGPCTRVLLAGEAPKRISESQNITGALASTRKPR